MVCYNNSDADWSRGSTQASEEGPQFREAPGPAGASLLEESKTLASDFLSDDASDPIFEPQSCFKQSFQAEAVGPSRPPQASWEQHLQETLYSRSSEESALRNAYNDLKNSKDASLILISGPQGAGKSRLARALKASVEQERGYFLSGKFDCFRRPAPYTEYVAAFTEFTNLVLARGLEATQTVRTAVEEAVGDDGVSVLIRMIPALERILGHRNGSDQQSREKDIQRFNFVFQSFLGVLCSPAQPMVLLLENLQYADPCSLDVLKGIVADCKEKGLVVIGTVDDSLVSAESYLSKTLRELEDQRRTKIAHIAVSNLDEAAVGQALSQAFEVDLEKIAPLSRIIRDQTAGNMFYMMVFIRWLQDSDLLCFDSTRDAWCWEVDEIEVSVDRRQIGDFLLRILERLPEQVKDVLKVAACLGPHLDQVLIEYALDVRIDESLRNAERAGALVFDETRRLYAFKHDTVQEAAYRLIPEADRELFHLEIGRRIWRKFNAEEVERHMFTTLGQMQIGRSLIHRQKEQVALATLCLRAGTKAAKASTFRTAKVYLDFGISMLSERKWIENYDLSLRLLNAGAEMDMCLANYQEMDKRLDDVLRNGRTTHDKVQAYATRIYALGVNQQQEEAIDLGEKVLKLLGEPLPMKRCGHMLMHEMKRVKMLLMGKSDEQLLRLPHATDPDKLACMHIIHTMYLNACCMRPKLSPFLVLKWMRLTLQYGLSALSSVAFAFYGVQCIAAFRDVESAFRYGKLALTLLDQFEAKEYLPRVYLAFYGCIYAWKKPAIDTLEPLMYASNVGLRTGDVEGGCLCANQFVQMAWEAGEPLDSLIVKWSSFHEMILSNRQTSMVFMVSPSYIAFKYLMGLKCEQNNYHGGCIYKCVMDAEDKGHEKVVVMVSLIKMMVGYIFNNYELAGDKVRLVWQSRYSNPTVKQLTGTFLGGMVALACARDGKSRRKNIKVAKAVLRDLQRWRKQTNAATDKVFILQGELASIRGQNSRAVDRYISGIALAKHHAHAMAEAIGYERMARHYWALNQYEDARPFFEQAGECWKRWGAVAKYDHLTCEVEQLYASVAPQLKANNSRSML